MSKFLMNNSSSFISCFGRLVKSIQNLLEIRTNLIFGVKRKRKRKSAPHLFQLSRTDIDQVSNTGNSVQSKVYFEKLKENKKKISSFAGGSTEYVELTNSIPHKMQYRFVISWYSLL